MTYTKEKPFYVDKKGNKEGKGPAHQAIGSKFIIFKGNKMRNPNRAQPLLQKGWRKKGTPKEE